jgi:hypothetical protein
VALLAEEAGFATEAQEILGKIRALGVRQFLA